ncbi:hypothetical protein HBI46_095720 [Parastagonospora nodorum]|nr:hypothetical protein HBH47_235600 [Parastagonospora nodorum]KAH4190262.1 hypothetical protein HBH42_126510 [Parastagonospora nodorum]KAH5069323.1 hypothetical protein HBH96_021240 [Parastagonospora nodorum]KAH5419109.1 hypothetical protein HBI46_095720 [Parastagonospora nodorum]KAH5451387.1 hypothetical protein HBI30_123860 [Parastagonospora nodorum]
MPKTFQDAIVTTKEFGIEFIWIDSLCIIQDSPSDWEYEAARMASVYSGATCTIAAVWGMNGTCGCFRDHCPTLRISIDEQRIIGTHITHRAHEMYLRPPLKSRKYLREAVLNTHAWTLQEIVLSRRIILFAEDQMYWHCTSLYESEDSLDSVTDMAGTSLDIPSLGAVARNGEQSKDMLYESWQTTMKSYSLRQLTNGGDKLAALAGITEFFGGVLADEAVAGLWRRDLGRGLMWQIPVNRQCAIDQDAVKRLNIPSWSWLKIKGEADPSVADTRLCVQSLDAQVNWQGLSITSQIRNSFITGKRRILGIMAIHKEDECDCFCSISRVTLQIGRREAMMCKVYWRMDECTRVLPAALHFLCIRFTDIDNVQRSDELVAGIDELVITPFSSS